MDELQSYILALQTKMPAIKLSTHSEEQWVVYDVHINSIEGAWDLFKTIIKRRSSHVGRSLPFSSFLHFCEHILPNLYIVLMKNQPDYYCPG